MNMSAPVRRETTLGSGCSQPCAPLLPSRVGLLPLAGAGAGAPTACEGITFNRCRDNRSS